MSEDKAKQAAERLRELSGDIRDCLSECGAPWNTPTYRNSLLSECLDLAMTLRKTYLAAADRLANVTETQLELLLSVSGLCHSEANKWERADPKTSEHWRKAAVELQGTYLAACAAIADAADHQEGEQYIPEGMYFKDDLDGGRLVRHESLAAADRLRADDAEAVTEEWLRAVGFLPDGDDPTLGEFAKRLWSFGEEACYGKHPAMHLTCSLIDASLWLEAYSTSGQSLCIVELPHKATRGHVRLLCEALGISLTPPE